MGMTTPVTEQFAFRFRNDDGDQATATWLAPLNTNVELATDDTGTYRVRVAFREIAGSRFSGNFLFGFNISGEGFPAGGGFGAVGDAFGPSTSIYQGQTTTQQISTGTFVPGVIYDQGTYGLALNNETSEFEYAFEVRSQYASPGDYLELGIYSFDGSTNTLLDSYLFPRVTLVAPTPNDALSADDTQTSSAVTGSAIAQSHALNSNAAVSIPDASFPIIAQDHQLLVNDTAALSTVSSPGFSKRVDMVANDVGARSTLTVPVATEVLANHTVNADDLISPGELSSGALRQDHQLTSDLLAAPSLAESALLTVNHGLIADEVAAQSIFTQPVMEALPAIPLTANPLIVSTESESVTLGQIHRIAGFNRDAESALIPPALAQRYRLFADNIAGDQMLTQPSLLDFLFDGLNAQQVSSVNARLYSGEVIGQVPDSALAIQTRSHDIALTIRDRS